MLILAHLFEKSKYMFDFLKNIVDKQMFDWYNKDTTNRSSIYKGENIMNTKSNHYSISYKARQKELKLKRKRNRLIKHAIFTTLAILFVSFIFNVCNTEASQEKHDYKYFIPYTVQEGDTLSSIASNNLTSEYTDSSDYINDVIRINKLSSKEIYSGQLLIVPLYSDEILPYVYKDAQ